MNSTKSKRWNGKVGALPPDYLKEVMVKMADYGDQVQFSSAGAGPQPSYQVMNSLGKKIAFDRNHHLLTPGADEFAGAGEFFTLDQIKKMIAGVGIGSAPGARAARTAGAGNGGRRITAAKLHEQFAARRYEYFRDNRQTLPPAIAEHSGEITDLMMKGMSVEEAFDEVLRKYF